MSNSETYIEEVTTLAEDPEKMRHQRKLIDTISEIAQTNPDNPRKAEKFKQIADREERKLVNAERASIGVNLRKEN